MRFGKKSTRDEEETFMNFQLPTTDGRQAFTDEEDVLLRYLVTRCKKGKVVNWNLLMKRWKYLAKRELAACGSQPALYFDRSKNQLKERKKYCGM